MAHLTVSVTARDTPHETRRVIELAGEADAGATHLATTLSAEVAARPALLILDLSGLTFMDSWALTTILKAAMALHAHGGVLALASPTPIVARFLELTDAAQIVRIHPTIDDATHELTPAPDRWRPRAYPHASPPPASGTSHALPSPDGHQVRAAPQSSHLAGTAETGKRSPADPAHTESEALPATPALQQFPRGTLPAREGRRQWTRYTITTVRVPRAMAPVGRLSRPGASRRPGRDAAAVRRRRGRRA